MEKKNNYNNNNGKKPLNLWKSQVWFSCSWEMISTTIVLVDKGKQLQNRFTDTVSYCNTQPVIGKFLGLCNQCRQKSTCLIKLIMKTPLKYINLSKWFFLNRKMDQSILKYRDWRFTVICKGRLSLKTLFNNYVCLLF